MSKPVTADKLIEDLQVVVHDAEALLRATAAQTGEKIQESRARTEESLRKLKARLGDVEDEALKRARMLALKHQAPLEALGCDRRDAIPERRAGGGVFEVYDGSWRFGCGSCVGDVVGLRCAREHQIVVDRPGT